MIVHDFDTFVKNVTVEYLTFCMGPFCYCDSWRIWVEVDLNLLSVLERMQWGICWEGDFPFISDFQFSSRCRIYNLMLFEFFEQKMIVSFFIIELKVFSFWRLVCFIDKQILVWQKLVLFIMKDQLLVHGSNCQLLFHLRFLPDSRFVVFELLARDWYRWFSNVATP